MSFTFYTIRNNLLVTIFFVLPLAGHRAGIQKKYNA